MIILVGKPGPRHDALRSLLNAMPELGAIILADAGPGVLQHIRDPAPALVFIAGGWSPGEAAELIRQIKHESPRMAPANQSMAAGSPSLYRPVAPAQPSAVTRR